MQLFPFRSYLDICQLAAHGVHNNSIYKGYLKNIYKSNEEEKNLHLLKMTKNLTKTKH